MGAELACVLPREEAWRCNVRQSGTNLEASWCRTQVTRAPEGTARLPVTGEADEGTWLEEAENTLYLPAAVTVATAQPSADNMACVGGSPPPPRRHVFLA